MAMNGESAIYLRQAELIALQRDARLLRQRPGLIRSRLTGNHLSPFKGRGMEFDESRPYQPGDDIRNMDWRVTARTNKPHSKVFREERERPVLLWTDFRASMLFGTRHCFKSVLAARVAALVAWKAVQQGDRLGALLFADQRHLELRPETGKPAALHIMRQLADFTQQDKPETIDPASGQYALKRLQQVVRPGSLIYLISDFRGLGDALESNLSRLSRHNELVLLHITDPLEQDLPPAGTYRVSDGSRQTRFNSADKTFRQNYQSRFVQQQLRLQQMSKKISARYLCLSTGQPALEGLMQSQNGSGRGGGR